MVRWLRWHCPPDTGFEIRALAVWDRARYLSVTEAPHNTNFHTWMGKKQFCFFQTANTGNRTPNSGVKGSGANHYPRAPRTIEKKCTAVMTLFLFFVHLKLELLTATLNDGNNAYLWKLFYQQIAFHKLFLWFYWHSVLFIVYWKPYI